MLFMHFNMQNFAQESIKILMELFVSHIFALGIEKLSTQLEKLVVRQALLTELIPAISTMLSRTIES